MTQNQNRRLVIIQQWDTSVGGNIITMLSVGIVG